MLKKKHISILVAVAAIRAAAVTSFVIKSNNKIILNQNVEALMDVEHWRCDQGGTFYCPML